MYETQSNSKVNFSLSPETRSAKQFCYGICCTRCHHQPVLDALSRGWRSHCRSLFRYHLYIRFIDGCITGLDHQLPGTLGCIGVEATLSVRLALDWFGSACRWSRWSLLCLP